MPRRINAWCDLALVAGYAEGRQEIDGEFIDLVISAQGGSLEDLAEGEVSISQEPEPLTEMSQGEIQLTGNGLQATVNDLSGRLSRLEGLVLEMTCQMMPALNKILQSSPESEEGLHAKNGHMAIPITPPEPAARPAASGWWSKLWSK